MKITRTRLALAIDVADQAEPLELEVLVRPVDQMVAEDVARRHGIGPIKDNPISHTVVWAYCAAVRERKYAGDFQEFRLALAAFDEIDEEPVDPTKEPATAPGSSSPATSETPDSGSTPTSTSTS